MAVGDRIKRVRQFRKMTMRELGMAVGFSENTADVRIAQYENNSREPKEELLKKIAEALDVNWQSLRNPADYTDEDLLFAFFDWEEQRAGVNLQRILDESDPACSEERVAVTFGYSLLNRYMTEWFERKQQVLRGEITWDEYREWKLNWPNTSDAYSHDRPPKKWRKDE